MRTGPVLGLVVQCALLAALAGTVGLSLAGWVVGLACGVATNVAVARGLVRSGATRLLPADRITSLRASLVGGAAALTADSLARPAPVPTLVGLAVAALVLDAVDGWVARRTGTASTFGWRFDMEVDAFLILVLSVYIAWSSAWWALSIGLARYAFAVAGRFLPWLRPELLPARYWRKVVAAAQGIGLTVAVSEVLPSNGTRAVLVAAWALLAESFGRDIWWLWRRRDAAPASGVSPDDQREHSRVPGSGRGRAVVTGTTTCLALLLVWGALVAPNQLSRLSPGAFVRIPLEALVVIALVLLLPAARSVVAWLIGPVLGLLLLVKIVDMGFIATLDRPFNPVNDWGYFGPAVSLLGDSIGHDAARASATGAALLAVVLLVLMTLSVRRLVRLVARHPRRSMRGASALAVVWVLCAVFGAQLTPGAPVASTSAADLTIDQVRAVHDGVLDHRIFAQKLTHDRFRHTPGDQLLTGLRGKDVIFAFVESYGKVAVQGSKFSPRIDALLDAGTNQLRAAGFSSRSAWLTSPTFGGISWLAHSTLQSGLWVDSQQRYKQLVASDRVPLSVAFKRAGWRTVGDVPSNNRTWTQGTSFYHYDQLYDRRNVGYQGPRFAYASMPDQYVLSAFRRLELAKRNRDPLMAEIDLVSSHTPWTRVPHMIDWDQVGDGSVFNTMRIDGASRSAVWGDSDRVRAAFGRSVEYSLTALISFVQNYGDDNLVLVVLGDHQPATVITGEGASHDVPISVIAHDPSVLDKIDGWGWEDGLRPSRRAPIWPMDAFRNRFLKAYGSQPAAP